MKYQNLTYSGSILLHPPLTPISGIYDAHNFNFESGEYIIVPDKPFPAPNAIGGLEIGVIMVLAFFVGRVILLLKRRSKNGKKSGNIDRL